MRSFTTLSGTVGAAALVALALAPAAQAQVAAGAARVVPIPCSTSALDSAITQANVSLVTTTIQLPINCTITIFSSAVPGDGLPVIKGDITLAGSQNDVIQRAPFAPNFRILEVASAGALTVEKLTIRGGKTLFSGGGIRNAGSLTVDHSTLSDNTAGDGGALFNSALAVASVSSTLMNGNTATGVLFGGGAILNSGLLFMDTSTIDSNSAPAARGGGLNNTLLAFAGIGQTTFTNNTAGNLGGGIYNGGTTSLDGSQVRLNSAFNGGGIFSASLSVTLTTSIVRDNTPNNCVPVFSGCS